MGWFFGKKNTTPTTNTSGNNSNHDPEDHSSSNPDDDNNNATSQPRKSLLENLDPSLKSFLHQQSSSFSSSPPSSSPQPQLQPHHQHPQPQSQSQSQQSFNPPSPHGTRYSHLWQTYTPHDPTSHLTPQEKTINALKSLHTRRERLIQAAYENCSFEESALFDCLHRSDSGWWFSQDRMCTGEKRVRDECVVGQKKLLEMFGYMSDLTRVFSEDDGVRREREVVDIGIQMRADRMWREKREGGGRGEEMERENETEKEL